MTRLDITSIGVAAGELSLPIHTIRSTAEELGIALHRINGVHHLDAADLKRIDAHIRDKERHSVRKHAMGSQPLGGLGVDHLVPRF